MDHADLMDQHQRLLIPADLTLHADHRVQLFLTRPVVPQATLQHHPGQKAQAADQTELARHAKPLARQLRHTDPTVLTAHMVQTELMLLPLLPAVQSVTKTWLAIVG
jgi:hypothetical protein